MPSNPIALITGGSSGIGAATARRLAAEGFHVIIAARRTDRLEALAKEIGATAVTADVTDPADVATLVSTVDSLGGELTLLVNNAGGARGSEDIAAAKIADWQWMYEVNVLGTVRVTQALLPALERSGAGTVVVLSSTAGLIVYEGGGGYAAAKHAQTAVVRGRLGALSDHAGRPWRASTADHPGCARPGTRRSRAVLQS